MPKCRSCQVLNRRLRQSKQQSGTWSIFGNRKRSWHSVRCLLDQVSLHSSKLIWVKYQRWSCAIPPESLWKPNWRKHGMMWLQASIYYQCLLTICNAWSDTGLIFCDGSVVPSQGNSVGEGGWMRVQQRFTPTLKRRRPRLQNETKAPKGTEALMATIETDTGNRLCSFFTAGTIQTIYCQCIFCITNLSNSTTCSTQWGHRSLVSPVARPCLTPHYNGYYSILYIKIVTVYDFVIVLLE